VTNRAGLTRFAWLSIAAAFAKIALKSEAYLLTGQSVCLQTLSTRSSISLEVEWPGNIVADNLSGHKTKTVFDFLHDNPTVRIHYTPTYSSWLNQVEIWFSKIQRDVIARGIFTSQPTCLKSLFVISSSTMKPRHPSAGDARMSTIALNLITQRAPDLVH
jgi:transposase